MSNPFAMDFGAPGGGAAAQNSQNGSAFDFAGANNQGSSSASAGAGGDPFSAGAAGATASTGAPSATDPNAGGAQAQPKFQPNPFQTTAPQM